eukprot:7079203-Alexandrium_andersonii.AAC.1
MEEASDPEDVGRPQADVASAALATSAAVLGEPARQVSPHAVVIDVADDEDAEVPGTSAPVATTAQRPSRAAEYADAQAGG